MLNQKSELIHWKVLPLQDKDINGIVVEINIPFYKFARCTYLIFELCSENFTQ